MRRIVHYYPDAMCDSGVTFALWSWARAQAAAGIEVTILHAPHALLPPQGFVSRDMCPGLTEQSVPHRGSHRLTRSPVALERYLGREDVLVLHEGWVPNNMVAAEAARRAGVPYLVMPHGVYDPAWTRSLKPPRRIRRRLERRVLEGAAAVHVFFESEIPAIASIAPCAAFITVPTGHDLPAEQWTGGGGYLGWLGRIDPVNKGLDVLARAIASLPAGGRPTVRIHGYDYKGGVARLQKTIEEQGVADSFRLEGVLAGVDKMRFFQQADGYILPSRWECHSIALLENLALGVPCLVSRSIHIARTLERSRAAVLAEPSDDGLADALARLMRAPADLAARGRSLVGEAFNWTALVPQFHASLGRLGLQ